MADITETEKFDIVVIGGGPGGYVAAIRASQLKMKGALVESQHMGGICLNWGCIPTKALLKSGEVFHMLHRLEEFGVSAENIKFDFKKIVERSRSVSAKLSSGVQMLMKKNKVKIFDGYGKLNGTGRIAVRQTADIEAKHIIIATGARARVLKGLEPDGKQILTYKEAMVQESLPKSLLVVGSGAIGTEFASFYNSLGSKVTLVEVQKNILPVEDEEISKLAKKSFEKQGFNIITEAVVKNLSPGKNGVEATIELKDGTSKKQKFEKVIMAVGIIGNSDDLGLEATRVQIEKGHIVTDEYLRTGEEGVYAIGDVTGGPWLAHKASHEGVIAVENIAGLKTHPLEKKNIPGCTYSHPQIASVGLTEKAAKDAGLNIKVGRFQNIGNGKAIALGEEEGLVKTIFDADTGELLGAHMIGAEVTELINGFLVGKTMEATEEDFMQTIFPHPTLSEMMHESVLAGFDRGLHM